MSYAKKLSKSYNAESAWRSLGTDLSAYDKSYLASNLANFRNISIPGFSEYTTSGPRGSSAYDQVYNRSSGSRYLNPRDFQTTLFDGFNRYDPAAAFSRILAGKYVDIV